MISLKDTRRRRSEKADSKLEDGFSKADLHCGSAEMLTRVPVTAERMSPLTCSRRRTSASSVRLAMSEDLTLACCVRFPLSASQRVDGWMGGRVQVPREIYIMRRLQRGSKTDGWMGGRVQVPREIYIMHRLQRGSKTDGWVGGSRSREKYTSCTDYRGDRRRVVTEKQK